jgi:transcription initiation factor TFIIIB Brf1 subunit/transcription initiation factor TFIIB
MEKLSKTEKSNRRKWVKKWCDELQIPEELHGKVEELLSPFNNNELKYPFIGKYLRSGKSIEGVSIYCQITIGYVRKIRRRIIDMPSSTGIRRKKQREAQKK